MRQIRAYCPSLISDKNIHSLHELPPEISHHLQRVLRLKVNDFVEIFDGKGNSFLAEIQALGKKISIKIIKILIQNTPLKCKIHLVIGLGKGEKMDWIIQKATELGVYSIHPVITDRSEVHLSEERQLKKHQHWYNIMINACEQCGLNRLVQLEKIDSLKHWLTGKHTQWLQESDNALKLMPHLGNDYPSLKIWAEKQPDANTIFLLIGPEGGFANQEVLLAQEYGFQLTTLGSRTLRMETAAITTIALSQTFWGDN